MLIKVAHETERAEFVLVKSKANSCKFLYNAYKRQWYIDENPNLLATS